MFIILDTETTDKTETSRLVQLAYKIRATNELVNEYFKPPTPISIGAMAVNHITNEMVADNPCFNGSEQQIKLKELLKNNIMVAHNAPFDVCILKNEGVEVEKYIDTLRVARHLIESDQFNLQYLRYGLKLNITGEAHNAMGDVIVLESLFEYLLALVKEKFDLVGDEAAGIKMIELTKTPALLKVFVFGKYIKKTFKEVATTDAGYLEWLYKNEAQKTEMEQNEELIYTLKHWLD